MKRGKTNVLGGIIVLLVLIAVLHTASHIIVYGTGIPNFASTGISGLSIGNVNLDEIKQYSEIPSISQIVIVIEWLFLIILILLVFVHDKINLKREILSLNQKKEKLTKTKTDLDVFYDLIKEKKHVKLSTAAKLFKVEKEIIIEWAKILESGNLVAIDYPRFGEPEIVLVEENETQKK